MSGAMVRAGLAAVTAVLLAAGVATACSSPPSGASDATALCSALDGGMVPGVALGALPQSQTDPVAATDRARGLVRTTCPQHEAAAVAYDQYLAPAPVVAPAVAPPPVASTTTTSKPTAKSTTRATPVRPKTRDAADAESDRLKSCMVTTGQTEAQCRAGGSDGRGESKAVTDSRAVGGGLAACIDQTGMTEAQCRAASAAGLGG